MKELVDDITKLTNEWYTLIGPDHHKDRDCHWYIETKWSYGQPPLYTIQHFGYILDGIKETWSTYELALERLKEMLTEEIKQYRMYATNEDEETGW
jgi:hypothetical protein